MNTKHYKASMIEKTLQKYKSISLHHLKLRTIFENKIKCHLKQKLI